MGHFAQMKQKIWVGQLGQFLLFFICGGAVCVFLMA